MFALHSVYNVQVLPIEGLVLEIVLILAAFSLHLLLLFLVCVGLDIAKLFGHITSWISSLQRKRIKLYDSVDRQSFSYYRFMKNL